MKILKENFLHLIFVVGIFIKSIDGLLELVAGVGLFLMKSGQIANFIQTIYSHELAQDPTDIVANYLIISAQDISVSTLNFAQLYLIMHGSIKLFLVTGLWLKKLWAYPVAGVVMTIFVVYQIIRIISMHSLILAFLTILDIIIIYLLRFEYASVTQRQKGT